MKMLNIKKVSVKVKMGMVSMILEWELHMPILLCIKKLYKDTVMEQEKCMYAMIQRVEKDVCCQWMRNWKS